MKGVQHDYLNNIIQLSQKWFIGTTLVMVLLAGMLACTQKNESIAISPGSFSDPLVLVLKDQGEEFSRAASYQVTKSLDYTKIPYLTIDLGIIARELSIPNNVRSLIVTTQSVQDFSDQEIQQMVEFVGTGGSLVFISPQLNEKFGFLQGLKPDANLKLDSLNRGFYLKEDAFPGMRHQKMDIRGLQPHFGIPAVDFSDEVQILATTATDTLQPFITSNKIGLGDVTTVNSFIVDGKMYRGILFSSILRGLKGVPYQVANVSTIFLDDFPAPLYNEELPPVDEEFGITHAEFVSKVWWPDMQALADSFGVDYSAMVAFNYNANVVPPFDFMEWRQGSITQGQNVVEGSIYLAKNIRDTRHELAFHGYNHFSLWREDWDNINFMISALQAARKRWQVDNLGNLPTNYVPPTNHIDSLGLEAVIRGMPSIKYMSSIYFGDIEEGGGREFDPDPYVPAQLFNYPRITSGFNMKASSLLDQHGMQLLTGIWTHFVHPDDVFQVNQREEDEFASRNPLGLGWRSSEEHSYGLYDLLSRRIKHTLKYYPENDFVSATRGAMHTEDWRRSLTEYEVEGHNLLVQTTYRANYEPQIEGDIRHWFMYIPSERAPEVERVLLAQNIQPKKTEIWSGYLFQFKTDSPVFFVPNLEKSLRYDAEFLSTLEKEIIQQFRTYQQSNVTVDDPEEWTDTRLEEAQEKLQRNPKDVSAQEELITLSIEFGEVNNAISILEERLQNSPHWSSKDISRLLTYYGWEGMQARAEQFLETLWGTYQSEQVINLKKRAVEELGLSGQKFEQRWKERELQLHPNDFELRLNYIKSIESQENWPEMKKDLRALLQERPNTDSLYAFTLQRSMYYETPDSTLALLEEFPTNAYPQLMPFASNLALMYGFEGNNYEQALYWANNAANFDERLKLYWISQLNLNSLYKAKALEYLSSAEDSSEVRSFVGTNLFYQGFTEEAYETLYPLFEENKEEGFAADTLLRNEIGYLNYSQKKKFYHTYPRFFDADQLKALRTQHRWNEGPRIQAFGEYSNDNFDNTFARGGLSFQLGNRLNNTHSLRTEYLVFTDENPQINRALDYQGIGYEFNHRSSDQQVEFRFSPSVLFGESDVVPEGLLSVGISKDSAFTSFQLTGGAELTSSSLQNNYYQAQLEVYRQDYWFNGHLVSALSASGKYYTNEVLRYGGQGRLYLDLMRSKFRIRPLAELGYSDATVSYLSGIPYYTPDQYFSQGVGLDLQYRNPNNFDYRTQLTGEILGKHERRDGFFGTGRIQLEHQFRNFWKISIGTEISTSSVYSSNRFFFTISHFFPNKL